MDDTNTTKTMLALTFIAEHDGGGAYTTNDYDTAYKVLTGIKSDLVSLDVFTLTPWTVVWGPAIFSFPINLGGRQIDNVVYMVRNGSTNEYAIAIAGTNATSLADLVLEDLLVVTTEPWSKIAATDDGTNPNISSSTYLGLNILLRTTPPAAPPGTKAEDTIPGSGQTLTSFLNTITSALSSRDSMSLYVTGHSLGGALSPALALALADQPKLWDSGGVAKLLPYAFAGPTPGDKDFVTHFANKIPNGLQRIWNALDVIPHAWDQAHLTQLPGLYGTAIDDVTNLVNGIVGATQNIGYTPVNVAPSAFSGPQQNPSITTLDAYNAELVWQHTVAYAQQFGLVIGG